MQDLDNEIRDLREKTRRNRHDFLKAELQTCFIAIDRAHFEISLGNTHEARKEFEVTRRGVQVLEHFLSDAPGQMPEVEAKLEELKKSTEALRLEVDSLAR